MQKFDFKKAFRDLHVPKQTPARVFVPKMSFIAVQGVGNPNDSNGAYQKPFRHFVSPYEIYLNNPNKTPPQKLKTILRIPVRES